MAGTRLLESLAFSYGAYLHVQGLQLRLQGVLCIKVPYKWIALHGGCSWACWWRGRLARRIRDSAAILPDEDGIM